MDAKKPLPPLKSALEAVEITHDGKPMVLLRDQEGIAEKGVVVSLPGFFILTMLDGRRTIEDVAEEFNSQSNQLIKEDDIQSLLNQLDAAGLLDTPVLHAKRKKILKEFSDDPIRKAHHVESGYPSDQLKLAEILGKFFKDPKGPGAEMSAKPTYKNPALGIVSPHIDFTRGGPAYAHAYRALSDFPKPDLIVGVGVAHMSPNSPWIITPKDFETPYGPMRHNNELFEEVRKILWYDPRDDEWVHRAEHSLEFQALWLKYLWRDETPAWLPILCSSFERFCPDAAPSTVATIDGALNQMGALLKEKQNKGQSVLILAGIDLGHVGPRFGDDEKLGPELEKRLEKEDKESLEFAMNMNADEMYKSVVANKHWRKWCGLSALYTAMRLIEHLSEGRSVKGEMLTYGQAPDPSGGIVSFTSALFR